MDIAVYCAWRDRPSREYRLAEDVGRAIAASGHSLIFGGGTMGTMGRLAVAAQDAGAKVTAVTIPEWKVPEDSRWGELIVTQTLGERKAVMDGRAGAVLVLPGSLGTLAEMFVSIEHTQGQRPTIVVDPWGYYEGLLEWLPGVLPVGLTPARARDARTAVALAEGRIPVR